MTVNTPLDLAVATLHLDKAEFYRVDIYHPIVQSGPVDLD